MKMGLNTVEEYLNVYKVVMSIDLLMSLFECVCYFIGRSFILLDMERTFS